MKKILLFTGYLCLMLDAGAQAPLFQWAKKTGGFSSDYGFSVKTDASGNVYTAGSFYSTADFDPGPGTFNLTSFGNEDAFVAKYDPSGNFLWAKKMGGASTDFGFSLAIDPTGYVYVTGGFDGTADFDPGAGVANLTSGIDGASFLLKLDPSGNFQWVRQRAGMCFSPGSYLAVDTSGDVYVFGSFSGTADLDPGASVLNFTAAGGDDLYILKLSSAGSLLWVKSFGGNSYDNGFSIVVDAAKNVYTTGWFNGTVDFDPGAPINNLSSLIFDSFVSKLDGSGNFVWARQMKSSYTSIGIAIAVDGSGSVYTSGYFSDTVDFDPGAGVTNLITNSTLNNDIFVSKLDGAGNYMWAKQIMGDSAYDGSTSIALDLSGNVYVTGYFGGTTDFDPGAGMYNLSAVGLTDIFVAKLNSAGNFVWAKKMGGPADDYGYAVNVDAGDNVYTVGYFDGTVDFDPDAGVFNLSAFYYDIFLQKMSQTPIGILEHEAGHNNIFLYPNPAENNLTIETTTPTTISIVNLIGQELYSSTVEKSATIDVTFLTNGIYFVKDLQNGGSIKFVKQ